MSPEERKAEIRDEYLERYNAWELATLLARIRISTEDAFYYADTDELGEDICSILGLNPEDFEQ